MKTKGAMSEELEQLLVQTLEDSKRAEAAQKKFSHGQKKIVVLIERQAENVRQKLCHELRSVDYYFDSLQVEVKLAEREISVVLDNMRHRSTGVSVPKKSLYFGPEGFDKVAGFFKKSILLPAGWSLSVTFDSSYYCEEDDDGNG